MAERSILDAARSANIGYRTLRTWLSQPGFRAALQRAQDDSLSATLRRLSALADTAIDTLQSGMLSLLAEWPAKIRAADVTLSQRARLQELHELTERVAALEAAQGKEHGES